MTRRVDFPLRRPRLLVPRRPGDRDLRRGRDVLLRADGDRSEPASWWCIRESISQAVEQRLADRHSGHGSVCPRARSLAVNLGALVPHKDHVTLLRAAALLPERLPQLHWVIAGRGPAARRCWRQLQRRGSACGSVCIFWDRCPIHSALAGRCRCLRHELAGRRGWGPRFWTPWPVASPLHLPLPVACPRCSATGPGSWCHPSSLPALADAVARLLTDPELRTEAGEIGPSRVVQGFSAHRMAAEVRSVYRSCAPN